FFPSSCGMTFSVDGDISAMKVTVRWGQYTRSDSDRILDEKSGGPRLIWKRIQREQVWEDVSLRDGMIGPLRVPADYGEVRVKGLARKAGKDWLVSLFLVNEQTEPKKLRDAAWLFQPELVVEGRDGAA